MAFRDFMNDMGRVAGITATLSGILKAEESEAIRMVAHCWLTMSRHDFDDFLSLMDRQSPTTRERGARIRDRFLNARVRVGELVGIEDATRLRREISHDYRYLGRDGFNDVVGIIDELSRSQHRDAMKAARIADCVDEIAPPSPR